MLIPLVNAADTAQYGAKATTLARMLAAGYAVPPGFVIPDAVLQTHLQRAGQAENLHATALDTTLQAALNGILSEAPLVVRSSAIGEDSAAHSFAGQLDTLLNVRGEQQLHEAVISVWSSLWSERCLHYQKLRGVRLDRMGVIVQQQVQARHAGVLFTHAPAAVSGGQPSIIIEYCNGLGEGLVSGEIDPGRIFLERHSGKLVSHDAGQDTDNLLNEHDITALFEQATGLEQYFGYPLDIEWAIDLDGKLWLLQARPITTNAAKRVIWTNANIAENFPEPVTPLLYSIVRRGYAAYFRNLGLGFGISRRRIAAMNDAFEHIVGVHGGRLYYNLSNIHTLISLAPGGAWLTRAFNQFVGATQFPPAHDLPEQGRIERYLEFLRVAFNTAWRYLHVQSGLIRFEITVDDFCARTQLAELTHKSTENLLTHLREFLVIRLQRWNDAALADVAAMVCYGLLQRQLGRWLPDSCLPDAANLHNNLLVGLPGLASHAPVEELWLLSRRVRDNAVLAELFARNDANALLQRLREPSFAAFHAELQTYLEDWGFRSSGELMLTRPSPEEDPRQTLELLRNYAALESPSPQQQLMEQAAKRKAATNEVAHRLSPNMQLRCLPFSRAWRFRMLLAAAQGSIRLRERARQKQAKLYVRLRHIVLKIGQHLVATGCMAQAEDVLYLECDELDALLSGHAMFPYDVADLIRQRRTAHQTLSAMTPPDSFESGWGEYLSHQAGMADTPDCEQGLRLQGTGVCGGRITANAAVLADASEACKMQQGDIVVTRQTDPGWACVFFLARGLVIERGGMLSHGAIIARELGIPAVVGVRDATRRIVNGSRISLDGDCGVVDILP